MCLLAYGLFAPALTVTRFWIFSDTLSILSGIISLWEEGHPGLFVVLITFSVVFPTSKLLLLLWLSVRPAHARSVRLLRATAFLNKFSFMDVFVASLLVVIIEINARVHVDVHAGLYAFGASVLTAQVATVLLLRVADSTNVRREEPMPYSDHLPADGLTTDRRSQHDFFEQL